MLLLRVVSGGGPGRLQVQVEASETVGSAARELPRLSVIRTHGEWQVRFSRAPADQLLAGLAFRLCGDPAVRVTVPVHKCRLPPVPTTRGALGLLWGFTGLEGNGPVSSVPAGLWASPHVCKSPRSVTVPVFQALEVPYAAAVSRPACQYLLNVKYST